MLHHPFKPHLCVPAYLLLALTGSAFAANVNSEYGYNQALLNESLINITANITLTGQPKEPGIPTTLQGSFPLPTGELLAITGNGTVSSAFSSMLHELNGISNLAVENFTGRAIKLGDMTIQGSVSAGGVNNVRFVNNQGGAIQASWFFGEISQSTFTGNTAKDNGGAVYAGNVSGGIHHNTFTGNTAEDNGGAVYTSRQGDDIHNNTFRGNTAAKAGGAVYMVDGMGGFYGNHFIGNTAAAGGAIRVLELSNSIRTSRFVGNQAHEGGAISVGASSDGFLDNVFIGNRATFDADYRDQGAKGGAISAEFMGVVLHNGVFLNNRVHGGGSLGGLGGAVYSEGGVGISADNQKTMLFYGNQHSPASAKGAVPNAIYWTDSLKLDAALDARILMLDPLTSSANTNTTVTKTNTGDWFLGGVSELAGASTWNIDQGSLTLTTVNYGGTGALGVVDAAIRLSHDNTASFTLAKDATLAGSGSIQAETITLNGTVRPQTWVNTGTLAADITNDISDADIAAINVAQTSETGVLKFEGNVAMPEANYHASVSATANSLLDVSGTLNLTGTNTLTLRPLNDEAFTDVVIAQAGSLAGQFDPVVADAPDFLTFLPTVSYDGGQVKVSAVTPTLSWNPADTSADNGTFKLDSGTFSINRVLAGVDKTLTKTGAGTLFLNGVNTYTGDTDVQTGTLRVGDTAGSTASVASKVKVAAGATIGGHGTFLGGLELAPGAIVSPGASIGQMTVNGDTDFSNTIMEFEVAANGDADKVKVVGGSATVTGATLNILDGGGTGTWAANTTYTLIDADNGVVGQFATVNNGLGFLKEQVNYTANTVDLLMTRLGASDACTWCQSGNQSGVFRAITSLPDSHAVVAATQALGQEQSRAAMDNLSGEIYGSLRTALLSNQRLRNTVQARMQGLAAGNRWAMGEPVLLASSGATAVGTTGLRAPSQRLWVNTWGYDGHTDGNRNAARAEHSGFGLALGGDVPLGDSAAAGLFFGYEDGKVKNGSQRQSRVDVAGYSLGGYVTTQVGSVDLQAGLTYSYLDFDARRTITVSGLAGKASADYKGRKVQAFAEASKPFALTDAATVTPYLNLTQSWLSTNSTRERGSAAALAVRGQNDSVFQTTLGLRAAYQLPTHTPVALTAHLGWAHAFGDTDGKTSNRFASAGNRFAVQGTRLDRDRALAGVGIEARLTPNASLAVGYDGQFGSHYKDHTGSVQLRVRF